MPIKRMLPVPLLLVVLLWLALALDPSEARRVATDRVVVYPTDRAPNATETGPKPWDPLPEMNPSSRLSNGTKSNEVQPESEIKGWAGLPGSGNKTLAEPIRDDITSEKISVLTNATTEMTANATRPRSEDKMIAFGADAKIGAGNRTELTMAQPGSIPIGPRITLESIRICPEGFTLSNDHCRKSA
ncbi:LOW QUALITY PROTEIN: uncharacterized protein LOC111080228 [Drosophila obscura]|uniref:LOW QUALITY PROTEIN: uncharacterized protein LOC111080228 n=1 Tax=Drosophila obscura TaxID=7282 RepID=UPI001BB1C1E9|nr:LOW QUALITY PROTEIN: uncharacterized protein LOC111080228 [Drosophila obscura]